MALLGKFVITGGPVSGKRTVISSLEQGLIEKGYRVFIIDNTFSELTKSGINPYKNLPLSTDKFVELLIRQQLEKENLYDEVIAALPKEEKCVIICDRGVFDSKTRCESDSYDDILNKLKLNENDLNNAYDMVIHLTTAAIGKMKYYNGSDEAMPKDEAIRIDKMTLASWIGHSNLMVIDNSTNFEGKVQKVLDYIYEYLGNTIKTRKQLKYLIDINKSKLGFIKDKNTVKLDIKQFYLEEPLKKDTYERRLRLITHNGNTNYYFTVQKRYDKGLTKVVTNYKMTEKEYNSLLEFYNIKAAIEKTRYMFVENGQYYKLDVFDQIEYFAILEVDYNNNQEEILLPEDMAIVEEVTDDPNYSTEAIAANLDFRIEQLKLKKKRLDDLLRKV